MSRTRRLITLALCAAVTASALLPAFISADTPATQKAPARDIDVINNELKAVGAKFHELVPSVKSLADAQFRKDNAEKIIPELQKIAQLLNEIATSFGEPTAAEGRLRYLAMGVALGDKEAAKALTDTADSKDPQVAISAKSALALGNWVGSSQDAKAQAKILDDYTVLAKTAPKEDKFAETLMTMSQLGPANEDIARRARGLIQSTLTGEAAQQLAARAAALDKPIVIAGRTTTDARFTSTTLKGKVILVDFWGTWCPPCRAAMPGLKKLYQTYHEKGLEIVGVDSDSDDAKVNAFTKENQIPWVQLREQSQTETDYIHPINVKFTIEIFPTTFIIDKKGILRHMENPEDPGDPEALIKKLLAEPAAAPPPAPSAPVPAK